MLQKFVSVYSDIKFYNVPLYEFVFSVGGVNESFKISTTVPENVIVCGQSTLQSIGLNKPSTLAVVYEEGDLLELLEDQASALEMVPLNLLMSCIFFDAYIVPTHRMAFTVCIQF